MTDTSPHSARNVRKVLAISAQIAIFVEQWSSESAGNEIRSRAFPFWMALPSQEYRFEVEVLPSGSTLPILIINQPPKNMKTTIPEGNTPEDIKTRRRIIKDFYTQWISDNPRKAVWNESIHSLIHVKWLTINEILGHAPRSIEATLAQFHLSEILSNAYLVSQCPPKHSDKNQKSFSKVLLLKWKKSRVLVGYQKSKDEYVLYYISGGQKIKAAR